MGLFSDSPKRKSGKRKAKSSVASPKKKRKKRKTKAALAVPKKRKGKRKASTGKNPVSIKRTGKKIEVIIHT